MKLLFIPLVVLLFSTMPVNGATLYAAGNCTNKVGGENPGYWKDGTWVGLQSINPKGHASVNSILVLGNDVYAAGYSENNNYVPIPGYWKNGSWTELPRTLKTVTSKVGTIVNMGNDIYIAGTNAYENDGDGVTGYWKNGKLMEAEGESLVSPDVASPSNVFPIVTSGTDVYVTGYQENGSKPTIPGFWKNGLWKELKAPTPNLILSAAVSGPNLYILAYAENNSGYWKNGKWISLPKDKKKESTPAAIAVSGTDVYVAGDSRALKAKLWIGGYWKNGKWNELKSMDPAADTLVSSMVISGSDLYVAGTSKLKGILYSGYWKNGVWTALTPLGPNQDAEVTSLYVK